MASGQHILVVIGLAIEVELEGNLKVVWEVCM